ncbi:diacylglycerol/lipid kinase family protein [Lacibacterium aquatile]|uniref:Diacylglycerol/lipid kinase family protein n=1 Tax=Lacibacterium aquatile TaxID=1168082 RepID=A0ABW5DQV4_9PROT
MRIALVLNADSGTIRGLEPISLAQELVQIIVTSGDDVEVELFLSSRDTIAIDLLRAFGSGAERVLVGGGDGTIRSAAEQAIHTGVPLGVLPLGTMNLFAKSLSIPLDWKEAARALAVGPTLKVDGATLNGRLFLCQSVMGLLPRLSRHREAIRGTGAPYRWWLYIKAMASVMARSRRLKFELQSDYGRRRVKALTLAVSNNLYKEEPGAFLSRASLTDGVLGLYIAKHRHWWWLAVLTVQMMFGRWDADNAFERVAVRDLSIGPAGRRFLVATDGEVERMTAPLRFAILPKALPVVVPEQSDKKMQIVDK